MVEHNVRLELRSDNLGICSNDFRIFWDSPSGTWVLANDFKMRRLRDRGIGRRTAEDMSHGHLHKKSQCEKVKRNILSQKRTKSRDLWILGTYVRVADSTYKHYDWVCGLYESKKNKKNEKYYNVSVKQGVGR